MTGRRPRFRVEWRLVGPGGLSLMTVWLSACGLIKIEDAPLDSLDPQGPFARQIDDLFWPVFWIAVGVLVLVQGALLVTVVVFRDRPGRPEPRQFTHSNDACIAATCLMTSAHVGAPSTIAMTAST